MKTASILIAGVGNIFLGDDAFGVEVVQRLARRRLPAGVRVVDFGIRGFDLAYSLLADDDATILVDALPRGEPPGTLVVLEPDPTELDDPASNPSMALDTHAMHPVSVLRLVKALGGRPRRLLVVGCEPGPLPEDEEGRIGLSPPVEAAVEPAIELVESLVGRLLAESGPSSIYPDGDGPPPSGPVSWNGYTGQETTG